MKIYKENYVYKAYKKILYDLVQNPEYITSPRGMEVKENTNTIIEVKYPLVNLYKSEARSSPKKYIAAELLWYFSGDPNPEFIQQYASLWEKIQNKDGTVNSNYGHLIFRDYNEHHMNQYQWVVESLKRDKNSRQSFMHFNRDRHQYFKNKDQVCTMYAIFQIRENKLNMTIHMRSNDVIFGFMTDWAFFSILHYYIYLHVKEYHPEITLGSYTHISNSMHLYERHYDKAKKMINSEFGGAYIPLPEEPIIDEDGKIKLKYIHIFNPIKLKESDNELLNWCVKQLK
jgi:thymidylate synthase